MMPQILFLNRFYWPDVAATAQQLTDLAEDLAAGGWNVTVVTGGGSYTGQAAELPSAEVRNGVKIHRIATTRFGRRTIPGRALDYLSYHLGASWHLLTRPCPDVVVALSDPPFILAPVLLLGQIRGYRTVYYLQDLYPQVARALGLFRDGVVYRLLEATARWLHSRCDAVIVLSDQMAGRVIANGASPHRVVTVGQWADIDAITPVAPADNWFLDEHDLRGKFVVLYSGNAGRGHLVEPIIEAAKILRDDPDVLFVFIGGGNRFPELKAAAGQGLTNLRFLDYLPREDLRYSLSAANLSLVTENPEVVGMLVPCKVYGILASGRPMLFMGAATSDVADIVREHGCGFVLEHDDADGVVDAIERLRSRPAEAARLGASARRAAETYYDRSTATRRWSEQLVRLLWPKVSKRAPAQPPAEALDRSA